MQLFRHALAVAAALAAFGPAAAENPSWSSSYPELVFATAPAENAADTSERFQPWTAYLSKALGVKVTLRLVNDYAAVSEGPKAGNIHIAYYGSAALARALKVTGGGVEPFVTAVNPDGSIGYYSVAYVKADSPYQKLEDLKGKSLGLVDPNSTSGNNMPRYAMSKMGIDPEKFFGKVVYTGSHENALMAIAQGTVDVAFNWWDSEAESNLSRMAAKGMVKSEQFRMIFKSPLLPGAPCVYLTSLPDDLKGAIRRAFMEAPQKDPAAFDRLSGGKGRGFAPVTADDYKDAVEMMEFVDRLHRKQPS